MRGAAALAESPHIEGKRVDSSRRQSHGYIVPCLTCPVGLMEQQNARAWLGCRASTSQSDFPRLAGGTIPFIRKYSTICP
jgi:hypothetical protein